MKLPGSALVLLLLPLLAGCIIPTPGLTDGGRESIDEDATGFVVPGSTTRCAVLLRLGEPDLVSPDGSAFLYYWVTIPAVLVLAVGPGGGAAIPFESQHSILVEFDQRGLVRVLDRRQPDPDDLFRSAASAAD